ncbi:hypothetical protein LPC08_04125 [Roseomonas sp. OT10]|uniref:hypothetical protein n=1 Tax=Roseomonas cutis TaxID=2897332 RepID=UPI001E2B1A7E|nr:hypothetical protein [Roseomonas sp. OT10]UFN49840.1 hypothetical protein LPC08_04125 [Roseomonas sp. OT10]
MTARTRALALSLALLPPAALPPALWPATALAAEPQCRFPGPWQRVEVMRTLANGPLSPLRIAADPSVLHEGGRYRLWFTNADSRQRTGIAYAESANGLTWRIWKKASAPDRVMDLVLAPPADGWDAPGIETANVLRTPEGGYRLYYSGNHRPQGSITYAIGMAESPDGITWTRRSQPVLEAQQDWEKPLCGNPADPATCRMGGVLEPSVLYDPAARLYRMWYVGLGEPRGSFRTYRIGHATSPDGIAWTRRPAPVLTLGGKGAWDEMWTTHVNVVADPKAGFHMFYFGSAPADYRDGVEIQRGAIGHAWSADGIAWQRNPANPILSPRPGQPDAWSLGGPHALIEDGRARLWYFASPSSGLESQIVLAEAPCGP